jgi:aminoglycoside/choline kinase family phosphotransferase
LTPPESALDITVEWLKNALPWKHPGCEPVSIEVEPDFGGPSLLGRLVRVRLNYAAQGCTPPSVIVKFQHQSSDWEASIYRLLTETGVRSVPQLLGAFEDGTLILEDLSPAQPGSQVTGCTLQQARDVLSILADIHGRFWGDHRVPAIESERFAGVIDFNMKQCWEPFKRRYKERLGAVVADFEWMWRNARIISEHRLSEPSTLFHGDVHAENLLFGEAGTNNPVLIDWQLAGRGLAANDVSFFLVKSLTVEQRRANEERLLQEYFALLPERAQREYGFDHFKLDYRVCVTRSMLSAVMLVGPRYADRADRLELSDILATRVIAAVEDLNPADAI